MFDSKFLDKEFLFVCHKINCQTMEWYDYKLLIMNKGVGFACITVPLMWIAVVNQNLKPLGMSQVWIRVYVKYILTTCVLELKDSY